MIGRCMMCLICNRYSANKCRGWRLSLSAIWVRVLWRSYNQGGVLVRNAVGRRREVVGLELLQW